MKRSFKKPRARRVRPPTSIKGIKLLRPRRSELRTIYKDLLTSDSDQRVTALKQALTWYDHCVAYVGQSVNHEWPIPALKHKNSAEQLRTQGITSSDSGKKESNYIKAIESYEALVNGFKPPKLNKILLKYKHDKSKLIARKKKLTDRYGEFLELINNVLKPRNPEDKSIDLRVDKIRADYRIDDFGSITLNRKLVAEIKKLTRKYGFLVGMLKLLPVLSESYARVPECDEKGFKTGRTLISNAKRIQSIYAMIDNLIRYSLTTIKPIKLIRRPRLNKTKI